MLRPVRVRARSPDLQPLDRRRGIHVTIDAVVVKKTAHDAEVSPGKRKVRVELDSFRISSGSILEGGATGLTVLDANSAQVSIVSSRVCCRRLRANSLHQLCIQLLRDRIGYFGFDRKDIIELAIVAAGPQVRVGACIDELHIHANLIGRPLQRAFQNSADVKLAANGS